MTATDITKYVEMYIDWGISFMPIFPRTKAPCLPTFGELADRVPTDKEIQEWKETYWNPDFWQAVWNGEKKPQLREKWLKALKADWSKIGTADQLDAWEYDGSVSIAVIGSRATGLVLCDLEDISLLSEKDQKAITGDQWKTAVVKTGKQNGYHIYFKFPVGHTFENKKRANGEIRCNRQYVVACPSVHPSGAQYKLIKEFAPREIRKENADEFCKLLLEFISATRDIVIEFAKTIPVKEGARSDWIFALTTYCKSMGIPKDETLKKILSVPICADKITHSGADWWETHQWDRSEGGSCVGLLLAAAKKSGVQIPKEVLDVVGNGTHIIRISADLAGMIKIAVDALEKYNNTPIIFQRNGELCWVQDTIEGVRVQNLNADMLRPIIGQAVHFFEMDTPKMPPMQVVKSILSQRKYTFPLLKGIIAAPALRPDGSMLLEPGYDAATGLYYHPSGSLVMPEISENSTKEDAVRAASFILDELLVDFPFDGHKGPGASRTNALAAIISPIVRPMIEGGMPMCLIDKPAPGTGASLLMDLISIIATGTKAANLSPPEDEPEWRKQITSWLRDGSPLICLDNIDSDLKSASLSRALTSDPWRDRILGRPDDCSYPQRATWYANGNDLTLRGDLARRSYLIRMDAKVAHPWERETAKFHHSDIKQWTFDHRGEILAAIMTMARAWAVAGRPKGNHTAVVGGFEKFTAVVGGILSYAGVEGFLGNADEMYDSLDVENGEWEAFSAAWFTQWGSTPKKSADVLAEISYKGGPSPMRDTTPSEIADKIKFPGPGDAIKVGKILRKRLGRETKNGYKLTTQKDDHAKIDLWVMKNRAQNAQTEW